MNENEVSSGVTNINGAASLFYFLLLVTGAVSISVSVQFFFDNGVGCFCLSVLSFSRHQYLHESLFSFFLTCPHPIRLFCFCFMFLPSLPSPCLSVTFAPRHHLSICTILSPIFPSISPLLPLSASLDIQQTVLAWWAPCLESLSAVSGLSSSKLLSETH